MKVAVAEQVIWFGQSIVLGVLLAIIYDCFRIFRIAVKSTVVAVFIEDILFFAIYGIMTFLFMLEVSQGQIRLFIIIGEFIGAVLYRYTISTPIMAILKVIVNTIKKIVIVAYRWIIKPIYQIISKVAKKIMKPVKILSEKYGKRMSNPLKCTKKMVYNLIIRNKRLKGESAIDEGER